MQPITFFLDFPLPTMNEMIRTARGNKFAAATQKKKYTNMVAWEIMAQTPTVSFAAISLDITWIETKKKRDPDNVFAAVKFICDGIVAATIAKQARTGFGSVSPMDVEIPEYLTGTSKSGQGSNPRKPAQTWDEWMGMK